MTEAQNRGAVWRGKRWCGAGGTAMAAVATVMLAPSMALAAASDPGPAVQPAAVSPGALLSWGEASGLGNGSPEGIDGLVPRRLNLPKDTVVSQVQGGCGDGIALTSKGGVVTWGNNGSGQTGNGTLGGAPDPGLIDAGGNTITSVQAGCKFDLALTASGQVLSWGDNRAGQLGIGVPGGLRSTPVQVHLPQNVQAAAISAGADFAMALTTTGQLYAWGDDIQGQLGDGTFHALSARPVLVRMPRGVAVRSVSAGGAHTLALTSDGLLSWGANSHGQLGNFTGLPRRTPFPVLGAGRNVTAISAGGNHSLALTGDGKVLLAWGANRSGQLGDDSFRDRSSPVQVRNLVPAGATITAISAGAQYSMALLSNNVLASWGDNTFGQLGINSTDDSGHPVKVDVPQIERVGHPPVPITINGIGAGPATSNGFLITPALIGI